MNETEVSTDMTTMSSYLYPYLYPCFSLFQVPKNVPSLCQRTAKVVFVDSEEPKTTRLSPGAGSRTAELYRWRALVCRITSYRRVRRQTPHSPLHCITQHRFPSYELRPSAVRDSALCSLSESQRSPIGIVQTMLCKICAFVSACSYSCVYIRLDYRL